MSVALMVLPRALQVICLKLERGECGKLILEETVGLYLKLTLK